MKCNIIRDLLPLYCDKLTSEDSNEEIEAHLSECAECADIYGKMSEKEKILPTETQKNIKPMKKLKKHFFLKLILGISATAAVFFGAFMFSFYGLVPIRSKNLSWRISVDEVSMYNGAVGSNNEMIPETENEEVHKMIRIHFRGNCQAFRTKSGEPELIYTEDSVTINPVITFYPILKLPFDNNKPQYTLSLDVTSNTDQTVTIHCLDKTIKLSTKELLEEYEKK